MDNVLVVVEELDRASPDRGEDVRGLLPVRDLEAERLVEADLIR